jgi:hypothetical protein
MMPSDFPFQEFCSQDIIEVPIHTRLPNGDYSLADRDDFVQVRLETFNDNPQA